MASTWRDFQDNKVVILNPKRPQTATANSATKNVKRSDALSLTGRPVPTASGKPARKVEEQVDAETGKPVTYVSAADASAVVAKRTAAKLTRDALAKLLNIKVPVLADIETCKAVENRALLARIYRLLDARLASGM